MPKPGTEPEVIYEGIPASPGIAIAPVHVIARGFSAPEVYEIEEADVPREQERFRMAVEITKRQLLELQSRLEDLSGENESGIFEAHVMMIEDRAVVERVLTAIANRQQNAEYAFYAVMQNFLEAMRRIPDPFLRERTADIEDVAQRVLRNFSPDSDGRHQGPDDRHILVAYDLAPSDTASMNRRHVLGFATEQGSVNSHTAILARAFGVPAVVGLEGAVIDVMALAPAILDGYTGKLILHPDRRTRWSATASSVDDKARVRTELEAKRGAATETIDGRAITVSANIEIVDELPLVKRSGAKGIGLYRTEFLLLNGEEMPDENHQTEIYSRVAREMAPHTVIIRTLDAGGDKLPVEPLTEPEPNPFLGWRGIRVSLARPAMFREQIRAILRASAHGKVAMMFPMISGLSEVWRGKEMVRRCMDELDKPRACPSIPRAAGGHHDRGARRRALRRPARARSRFLLHRHQRPHPIHRGGGPGEPPCRGSLPADPPGGHPADQAHHRRRHRQRHLDRNLRGNGRRHPPDAAAHRAGSRGAFGGPATGSRVSVRRSVR